MKNNNSNADIIIVKEKQVKCDGITKHTLGHPLIYLNMGQNDEVVCPYCSRHFIYKAYTELES